jgi:hypothetical protein
MIPVYVPSKGRAGRSSTLSALAAEGTTRRVTVVVPSTEEASYQKEYSALGWQVMTQRARGVQAARQTILDEARALGEEWLWMLDDDTTGVYGRNIEKRFHRISYETAFTFMERVVKIDFHGIPVMMAGPQFRHRAWSGPDTERDVHLRNFILVAPLAGFGYWPHVKEDLDMVLQVLTAGASTLRFNAVAFDSPTMGTLEGGCSEDYAAGALEEASAALVEKWPGIVSLRFNEKQGRVENRVNWRAARQIGTS